MTAALAPTPNQIANSRIYKAPRELVFRMFTDAEHISNWWGPRGFSTKTKQMDVKPGGLWLHTMISEEGVEYPNEVRYVEVNAPRQIIYDHINAPLFRATINFNEIAPDKTEIDYTLEFQDEETRKVCAENGAVEGLHDLLERFEETLSTVGGDDFVLQREFAAPKELVYRAWAEPERFVQWFAGPGGVKMTIKKAEIRKGGQLVYGTPSPDGKALWVRWIFRELKPYDRIVVLVTFVDDDGNPVVHPHVPNLPIDALSTVTFEERGGKTLVTLRRQAMYANEEQNKAYVSTFQGMGSGMASNLERLETYLGEA